MEINVNDKNAKKVLITETILRDAHQSQAATRMRIDEMIPALDLSLIHISEPTRRV